MTRAAVHVLACTALLFTLVSCTGRNTARTSVGERAPPFSITTSDGTALSLSDFQGAVLLITSTGTWCQTCVIEAEELRKVYQECRARGCKFLTVSIDPAENKQVLEEFRSRMNTPWFYATRLDAADLIRAYNLDRFEITYVIDATGVIRYRDERITKADDLRPFLDTLLPNTP